VTYLLLADGLPVPWLGDLPRSALDRALRQRFGEDYFDVLQAILTDHHLWVTLVHGDTEAPAILHSLAEEFGLNTYDPQAREPSPDDFEWFAFYQARIAAEALNEDVAALLRSANSGDTEAINELANRYAFGEGVAQDDAKAVHW